MLRSSRLPLAATLLMLSAAIPAAEGASPTRFEDQPTWATGVIDERVGGDPKVRSVVSVTADHAFTDGLAVRIPKGRKWLDGLVLRGDQPRTLTLGGPLRIDLANEGESCLYIDESVTLDFAGKPAVIELASRDSQLDLRGPIRNAAGLTRRGRSARTFLGSKDLGGITGSLRIEGGRLTMASQATLPKITAVDLVGLHGDAVVLDLEEAEGISDRLPDGAAVTTSCGARFRLSGCDGRPIEETLGRLTMYDNLLKIDVGIRSKPTTLTITELVRRPGALLAVDSDRLGTTGRIKVAKDAAIRADLRGGGGGAGSTTVSILPWVRGRGSGHLDGIYGFVTYDSANGFRELAPKDEYVQSLRAATKPTDNVRVAGIDPAPAKATTINALLCDLPKEYRRAFVDLGDTTLTIASGAVSTAHEITILGGDLTTGNDLPLVFVGFYNLNTRLVGTGGAVFFACNSPTRITNQTNTLTGDWTVAGGRLMLTDDEIIPDSVTVRLHGDGYLECQGSESITAVGGNGTVWPATGGRSLMMLGRCVGQANQVVMGIGGSLFPGDQSPEPTVGTLHLWAEDSDDRVGFLKIEGGTLAIDLAADGHDAVDIRSKNKAAHVSGGTLRINRIAGFKPKIGTSWDIITGSAPASGRGFSEVIDTAGKGYAYRVEPVENRWVLTVTAAP